MLRRSCYATWDPLTCRSIACFVSTTFALPFLISGRGSCLEFGYHIYYEEAYHFYNYILAEHLSAHFIIPVRTPEVFRFSDFKASVEETIYPGDDHDGDYLTTSTVA